MTMHFSMVSSTIKIDIVAKAINTGYLPLVNKPRKAPSINNVSTVMKLICKMAVLTCGKRGAS